MLVERNESHNVRFEGRKRLLKLVRLSPGSVLIVIKMKSHC
jgi:hypothetical protein